MKKMMLIAFVTLTGVLAQAADRNDAAAICSKLPFESDRDACISTISKYSYFDRGAIEICKSMSFGSDAVSCVAAIGDKSYEEYEIQNCGRKAFGSDKAECLRTSGSRFQKPTPPPVSCLPKQQLIFELQRVDQMLSYGDSYNARNAVYNLLMALQQCP